MIQTYDLEINEFVDWVSGYNSITDTNETNNLPVSGGRIRELLLNRLRDPMYLYLDQTDSLYKIFSSKESYQIWSSNKEKYADLVRHTFVGPASYSISVEVSGSTELYVKKSDNTVVPISYHWSIQDVNGNVQPSAVSANITIRNGLNIQTGALPTFSYNSATLSSTIDDIYQYLNPGTNFVNISLSATDFNAQGSATLVIYVIDMTITSDFDNSYALTANESVNVTLSLVKSLSGSVTVHALLDGNQILNKPLSGTGNLTTDLQFKCPIEETKHTLIIYTSMSNGSGSATIYSNLLYYEFSTSITDSSNDSRFLNIQHSFDISTFDDIESIKQGDLPFKIQQYSEFILKWAYYYANAGQAEITWKIENEVESVKLLTTKVPSNTKGTDVKYIPEVQGEYHLKGYIGAVAVFDQSVEITKGPDVYETSGYLLKLNAYGKSNEVDKTWDYEGIHTEFTGVQFTPANGWYENSFRTKGLTSYATVDFNPFTHKAADGSFTFEIEFYTEYINSDDDLLISIGDLFEIYPNRAILYDISGNEIIKTNFKSNERIKLAFIINGSNVASPDTNLAYIVNNGILERGASVVGVNFNLSQGKIKIGGSRSGVRVYNMRHYNRAITYTQAYDNYVFDSTDKGAILSNNNILNADGKIDSDLCANKLDVIIIEGNISKLLNANTSKEESEVNATISRRCNYDSTKNFTIKNGKIRKHGQSTLNYPIPSFKIWSNSSAEEGVVTELEWPYDPGYNKNRYTMKDSSIPANKWILQANYADSSGVHNGGLQRLIHDTWYNAKVDGEFKLRTPPQLFASKETISYEDATKEVINGYNQKGKKLNEYINFKDENFPYDIRVAPDSFPVVVFYRNVEDGQKDYIFLGQYVFMEDKKSDYCYGQRSIYNVAGDPFCLLASNKSLDTSDNLIWDNKNVLRIEVLTVDSDYSSYLTDEHFEDVIYKTNEDGTQVPVLFNWESDFELVYPDPDDLELDETKYAANSKFRAKTKPFIDWYKWLVSCKKGLTNFRTTAHHHIDLYKMAAYYIYCMRFGLVDSMERNVQIKTYDGQRFWYEPWDMDIALGNRNTGGIAFNPPIDRNTTEEGSTTKFALSGHNNYLWNQLEGWSKWINEIVPAVADALYKAGLSYDNITAMFDDNYQNKWCEIIYNQSGHFKYVEQNSGDGTSEYLAWLQGARTTHRHWWLKTSMDYWDAKWACGDFKNHTIYAATTKPRGTEAKITLTASTTTYFNYALNYIMQELKQGSADSIVEYDLTSLSISPKVPFNLYGTLYIRELDLSALAAGLSVLTLDGAYSDETGSNLIYLNIGNKIEGDKITINNTGCSITGLGNLVALETLDMSGQHNLTNNAFVAQGSLINFYAAGTNLLSFSSSLNGNLFNTIHLPSSIATLTLTDSNWETIKFYNLTIGLKLTGTIVEEDGTTTEYEYYDDSVITESNTLRNIISLNLLGTTGREACSKDLVFKWIDSILDEDGNEIDLNHSINIDNIHWTDVSYEEVEKISKIYHEGNSIKGYIRLKDDGLSPEKLLQLTQWFGDTVFVLNGGGLTIDYAFDTAQIILGSPAYIDGNDFSIKENGVVTIKLRYVKFVLQETDFDSEWSMTGEGTTLYVSRYRGCEIFSETSEFDGSKSWYLRVTEAVYGNYDITLKVDVNGASYYQTVHIISATYPTGITIHTDTTLLLQQVEGKYILQGAGSNPLFYFIYDSEFDALITLIDWKLKNSEGQYIRSDLFIELTLTGNNASLYCISAHPIDSILYTLEVLIKYLSSKETIQRVPIVVYDDTLLVSSATIYLFNVMLLYDPSITLYYRSNVENTKSIDLTSNDATFSMIARNDRNIFDYLINLETLNASGSEYVKFGDNVDLSNITTLKYINAVGCINEGIVDLSSATDLNDIDLSNSYIDLKI